MRLESKCRRGTEGLRDGINRLNLRADCVEDEAVLKRLFEILFEDGAQKLGELIGAKIPERAKGKKGRKA